MEYERPVPALIDAAVTKWQILRRLARESHVLIEGANRALIAEQAGPAESLEASAIDRIRKAASAADDYSRVERQLVQAETAKALIGMGHPELTPQPFK